MPVDIDAAVIGNTRLSEDYSVLALAAPEIAIAARPGQFVMLKTSRGMDPLLRRPFSIFEVLRNADGSPRGITILNKRIGTGTGLLYDIARILSQNGVDIFGARVATLGERAEDIFTVGGERLGSEKDRLRLERELLAVL